MRAAFHIFERVFYLIEAESFINHRLDVYVLAKHPVHIFEHLTRADENALHSDRFHQNINRIESAVRAGQNADHGNMTAQFDGV